MLYHISSGKFKIYVCMSVWKIDNSIHVKTSDIKFVLYYISLCCKLYRSGCAYTTFYLVLGNLWNSESFYLFSSVYCIRPEVCFSRYLPV